MFRLGFLSLLLCFSGVIVCGQNADLEEAAMRRAKQFEPIIIDAAKKNGVNPYLLWVIGYLETRFDPKRKSGAGAQGLMQFMPVTATRYGLRNPYDPIAAIDAAARHLRDLAVRFDNRADLALAAYNSGELTVDAYLTGRTINVDGRTINPRGIVTGGIPPYRETQKYVSEGLHLIKRLQERKFLSIHIASATGKTEADGNQPAPHSLTRKSVRANAITNMAKARQQGTRGFMVRRSIYFSSPCSER